MEKQYIKMRQFISLNPHIVQMLERSGKNGNFVDFFGSTQTSQTDMGHTSIF